MPEVISIEKRNEPTPGIRQTCVARYRTFMIGLIEATDASIDDRLHYFWRPIRRAIINNDQLPIRE